MNDPIDATRFINTPSSPRVIKALIPAKICYFAIYGTMGCVLPYLINFFHSIGLSVTQSGLIAGIRTIFSLVISPCFGAIANHFRREKLLLMTLLTLTAATIAPLPWIAKAADAKIGVENSAGDKLFYVMLLMLSLTAVFGIANLGFIDSAAMRLVQRHQNETTFGYQRVFGPIGLALFSFLAGFLSDQYQIEGVSKYSAAFVLYLPCCSILFVAVIFLDQSDYKIREDSDEILTKDHKKLDFDDYQNESIAKPSVTWHKVTGSEECKLEKNARVKAKEERKIKDDNGKVATFTFVETDGIENQECECVLNENKTNVAKTLFSTCRQLKVIFFLIIAAHMGINFSLINGFQAIFMEKELGTTKTIIGIASALSPVSEILAFPVSAKLIKLFGGIYPSFIIATFSYCLRFLLMSFVEEPYLILPIQLFQFFGFAIFWAAAVEYTNKISPIKISVTMFTIVTSVYYSLGNIVGNIVGGVIYDEYGGRWLFRASSINCGFMTGLIILYFFLYEKRSTHSSIDVPKS